MRNPVLVVCDLDNTIYDWVGFFVPAFYRMSETAAQLLKVGHEHLLDELRSVHQHHRDSEHPFALFETQTARNFARQRGTEELVKLLDPALHAFNSTRKDLLQLYPGVLETLRWLEGDGCRIVAHTESKFFAAVDRLKRLEVYEYFSHIYCRERSEPQIELPIAPKDPRRFRRDGRVTELQQHQSKPDPQVLLEICAREGFPPSSSMFVGDSVARDMLMAKRAGVFAVWARYGTNHSPEQYSSLVRVTHWTAEDVKQQAEQREEAQSVAPDFVCERDFGEVRFAVSVLRNLLE